MKEVEAVAAGYVIVFNVCSLQFGRKRRKEKQEEEERDEDEEESIFFSVSHCLNGQCSVCHSMTEDGRHARRRSVT